MLSHSWVPQAKVDKDQEGIDYKKYEKEGWLTIIPGQYVKYEYVYDWFVESAKHFNIAKITFDPANAFRLNHDLQSYGFTTEVVRQGALTLNKAIKDMKEMLIDGNVISNDNRLLQWYINNVKLKEDRNGNWLPQKQSRYRKIDGFAAFLNAHTEALAMMVTPQGEGNIEFVSVSDLIS